MRSPCCLCPSSQRLKVLEKTVVARQVPSKHVPCVNKYARNIRTAGHGIFCAVRVISDIQYAVKGKQAISSSQNFLLFLEFLKYKLNFH
jgi:hypothetical protein